jgi:peptidoglycan hydrolase FlgJ
VTNPTVGPTYYADFAGLEGLKKNVKADDPQAIRAAAQQFESLFTNMMLKSMREAKLSQGLGDSPQSDLYQDMFDQQMSLKMAQGKGIGLADMLVQQLTRNRAAKAAAVDATPAPGASTGAPSTGMSIKMPANPASNADRISFVKSMEPYAQQAADKLGVSPDTLIAQAALETGWGQHVPSSADGSSSFNVFGIKTGSGWNGDAVEAMTTEASGGHLANIPQSFRAYSTLQQGVNDYATLLSRNSRYQAALGTGSDVHAFASGLARGGYATDPDYVQKLQATAVAVKALRVPTAHDPLKLLAGVPTTSGGEA